MMNNLICGHITPKKAPLGTWYLYVFFSPHPPHLSREKGASRQTDVALGEVHALLQGQRGHEPRGTGGCDDTVWAPDGAFSLSDSPSMEVSGRRVEAVPDTFVSTRGQGQVLW